jgi:hypothetical protein
MAEPSVPLWRRRSVLKLVSGLLSEKSAFWSVARCFQAPPRQMTLP